MMRGSGPGWWFVGAVFMVICIVMMGRMMMGHGHSDHRGQGWADDPERTLANRLANGQIDADEYKRLLETLRHTEPPVPS